MQNAGSINDLLLNNASLKPDQICFIFQPEGEKEPVSLTNKELFNKVRSIAGYLQSVGKKQDRVLLFLQPGLEYVIGFLGCISAGMVPVPSYPPKINRNDLRVETIIRDAEATLVIAPEFVITRMKAMHESKPDLKTLYWLDIAAIPFDQPELYQEIKVCSDELAYLQYTSGSTSIPRGVMISHKNILHNLEQIYANFGHSAASRGVIWLPPYHDMGLIGGILQPVYGCFPVTLLSPFTFLQKPYSWLKVISDFRATTSGGPDFAYELCVQRITDEEKKKLDLSCWDVAFNGAEPIRELSMEHFYQSFKECGFRREAFHPCYGLAESTLMVSGKQKHNSYVVLRLNSVALEKNIVQVALEDEPAKSLVSSGNAFNAELLNIVHPESKRQLGESTIGEIWVASDSIAEGYWHNTEATIDTFRNYTGNSEGPFMCTGDLGFLRDGELYVTGRIKDLIIIRGKNYYPHDIEKCIETSHPGFVSGSSAAFSIEISGEEKLAGVFEVKRDYMHNDLTDMVLAARTVIAAEFDIQLHTIAFVRFMSIPKTSSGKIQRQLCRKMLLEKKLPLISCHISDNQSGKIAVEDEERPPDKKYNAEIDFLLRTLEIIGNNEEKMKIVTIFLQKQTARILKLDELQLDIQKNLFAYGMDSLQVLSLVNCIDEVFGIRIPVGEFFDGVSLVKLGEWIIGKQAVVSAGQKNNASGVFDSQPGIIKPIEAKDYYPLSPAQLRFYLQHQQAPHSVNYNVPLAINIESELDVIRIENGFRILVARHEILRTRFEIAGGTVVQRILPDVDFILERFEVAEDLVPEIVNNFIRPFDLSNAPLLRAGFIKINACRCILIIDMPHIVSDGITLMILIRELLNLYRGEELPRVRIAYKDYALWQLRHQETNDFKNQLKYWCALFNGGNVPLTMPLDYKRSALKRYIGKNLIFRIPVAITEELQCLAKKYQVSMHVLIFAAYALLLSKYSGQQELVIGSLVQERNRPELENLPGAFVNFLPLKICVGKTQSFTEFLDVVNKSFSDAYKHAGVSFEKIIEACRLNTEPGRNPLFDTMLVYHHYQDILLASHTTDKTLILRQYDIWRNTATIDFKLDVIYEEEYRELKCVLEYDTGLFRAETMERFADHFMHTCATLSHLTELSRLVLFTEEQERVCSTRRENVPVPRVSLPIVICSSFTADTMQPYIQWWAREFSREFEIIFTPYNQIFQELLEKNSTFSVNTGINILLIRFDDWIRNDPSSETEKLEKLDLFFCELQNVFRHRKSRAVCFCGIFAPVPPDTDSKKIFVKIQAMNLAWIHEIESDGNAFVIDFRDLGILYNVSQIFDPVQDAAGHMPFSRQYYAALGTAISRKLICWSRPPFKAVVLDCDNVLWEGVCGEEGSTGVKVHTHYRNFQKWILDRQHEGMLLLLCSKNNEADVWEVFENNPDMVLKQEHLAGWKINWRSKSENIRELAVELNLGLDSFIFIDDSPVETGEVISNCPQVLTLRLPEESAHFSNFLNHIWAFDRIKVTAEDRERTRLYQQEKKRLKMRVENPTIDDFIINLELKVAINEIMPEYAKRVSQLSQRTNQFNLSTRRLSEADILALAREPGTRIWIIEAADRFGEYGISGVIVARESVEILDIDTFLLSCRVLGRRVELAIMSGLKKYCCERKITKLRTEYWPTEKNQPALTFLENSGWEKRSEEHGVRVYELPVAHIVDNPDGITLYYLTELPKLKHSGPVIKEDVMAVPRLSDDTMPAVLKNGDSDNFFFSMEVINENSFIHKAYLKPLQWHTGLQLLSLPLSKPQTEKYTLAEYVEPRNQEEEKLIKIWEDILSVGKIGILDRFMDLGGNSLTAVSMLSCIHKEFQADLPLHVLLENQKLCDLAQYIVRANKTIFQEIQPVPVQARYRLSPAQERLHFLQRLEPGSTGYNIPALFDVAGRLDPAILQQTVKELISRHEVLRTSFETGAEHVYQRIHPRADCCVRYWDLAVLENHPFPLHSNEFKAVLNEFIRPFNLSQAPLVRVGFVRINEEHYFILCDIHHIISDGVSMRILMDEFARLYSGEKLPALQIHYKDFAVWQIEYLKGEEIKKQEAFWLSQFKNEIPVLNLATDFRRPAYNNFEGDKIVFYLDGFLFHWIHDELRKNNVTLHMLLLTVLNILLYKYTGQDEIIIGTPVAGRMHHSVEKLIGMFVNTLALRNRPSGEKTFHELLNEVKKNSIGAYENQDYQFEELVGKLRISRDVSRNPLFDVMFILQNMEQKSIEIESLSFVPVAIPKIAANFDLTLVVEEAEKAIHFELIFRTQLFKKETMERFAGHFLSIMETVLAQPDIMLQDIDMLTPDERKQVLTGFNNTAFSYPSGKTIQQLFEAQVESTPHNIALIFEEVQLTYQELNARANSLACVLRTHGVKVDVITAIVAERSPEILVGILGILKAGGVFLPIDPEYPSERIKYMLEDSHCQFLLTQTHLINRVGFNGIVIDLNNKDYYLGTASNPDIINEAKDLAYVIYTSGSSGKPKGVMIEHRSVINFIEGITARIDFNRTKKILALTTISFDIFGLETLLPLTKGLSIVMANREEQLDPEKLCLLCERESIDMIQLTPSRLQMITDDEKRLCMFKKLSVIMVGGEPFPEFLLEKLKKITLAKIYNMYGPTETTIWSTVKELTGDAHLDIGTPITNTQIYIVRAAGQLQPVGIAGELYIAGDGVARGYFNRPELTAERFVDNPFIPGTKMYKTGDLARWRSDGNIEFLGRSDFQVKIRGYRIEIEEIENILVRLPGVQSAVVVCLDTPGHKRLAAYCVADEAIIDIQSLRDHLKSQLPEYMVPSFFKILKELPKTPNGKIDRKMLPVIEFVSNDSASTYCAPESDLEKKIAAIWQDVLKIERVGLKDNFFELGGTSLMISQVLSRIRHELHTEIPVLKIIYENPTVGYLADIIETVNWHQAESDFESDNKYEEGII